MEKTIIINKEIVNGVYSKEEINLKLNSEQYEIIKNVARECDCIIDDVLLHLTENKNLLSEFYTKNLNNVQEELISVIHEKNFFECIEEDEVRKIDVE